MTIKKKSGYWQLVLQLLARTSACGMVGFMKRTHNLSDNKTITADSGKGENNDESNVKGLPVKRRYSSG
jgi:hypothetical protein